MNDLIFFKLITSLHRFHPLIYPHLFFVTVVSHRWEERQFPALCFIIYCTSFYFVQFEVTGL